MICLHHNAVVVWLLFCIPSYFSIRFGIALAAKASYLQVLHIQKGKFYQLNNRSQYLFE